MSSAWSSTLRPHAGAGREREPFSGWWQRVRAQLANVPENVAEHWIHRHFDGSPYTFLPLERLRFERRTWSLEQLDAVTFGSSWSWNLADVARLDRDRAAPLAAMMIDAGTWPEPIIVLDNSDRLTDDTGARMGRWQLIEGHKRLTYLRCLASTGSAQHAHDVWIATLESPA